MSLLGPRRPRLARPAAHSARGTCDGWPSYARPRLRPRWLRSPNSSGRAIQSSPERFAGGPQSPRSGRFFSRVCYSATRRGPNGG
eukprot:12136082-Alexandrium_andersonii.AAC.1